MLNNMKEQIKEQQAQSNCDQEQMALDHENIISEQKVLRQLNK